MAGHSHWAQVKHKKSISDAKKGQLFSKLIREITVAARQSGASPEPNPRLRRATERGRAAGLAKENIERAVERASGRGQGAELFEFLYEASAPGGVIIIIEGITDNKNRTLAEIKHILNQYGGRMVESGSLIWNFDKIGLIELSLADNPGKTREELELAIIESGAIDFQAVGEEWLAETPFTEGERVRRALEANGIVIKELSHDYKPRATLETPADARVKMEPLLDALADHEDVQEVYTNLTL